MTTITYCKGLPTPANELNELGFTQMEMFLAAYAAIFHQAACATTNRLLNLKSDKKFNKASWNTYLQQSYKINKRHANGVIIFAKGAVDTARENRKKHIKTLEGKAKSCESWLKKSEKKLNNARKFYAKNNWRKSRSGCRFPLSCSLQYRDTNWQKLRFQIHNKKRKLSLYRRQIEHLLVAPIRVVIPRNQVYVVGSKDESCGNQACQWDGKLITFRVPYCLESEFGEKVSSQIGDSPRKINRLPTSGAKTWHFYRKGGKWIVAVQFTPDSVRQVSRPVQYGCIGIDMNPGSIGWGYVDGEGNLKAKGKIPLQTGLPKGKQQAQIVDACLQLAAIADAFSCPVVCEELDFSTKKEQLRERGRKYAKMLSSWAYSAFFKQLNSILSNRGIQLLTVNPAYTSLIGLVKYVRIYGLASDEAAGMAVARRAMRLSEKMSGSITAYLDVKSSKHVWNLWSQLNNKLKSAGVRRHCFYSISNWESQAKLLAASSSSEE